MRPASMVLLAALLVPGFAARAANDDPFRDLDCRNAKVQMELNYCADRDFQAADKKLNAVYRKVLDASVPKDKELLKAAERNWIAWRDSECAYETAGSEGGSIQPMEYSEGLTRMTEARIKDLQQ